MENKSFISIVIVFVLACVTSCASANKNRIYGIDEAIQKASLEIGANLPKSTKIAVINFSCASPSLSDYVIEELSLALAKNKSITVVDRKNLDLIQQEMNFQLSGEVDDNSALAVGKKLGAQFIITGSFVNAGTYYRFRANAINVETAAREAPVSIQVNIKDAQVAYFLNPNENDGAKIQTAGQPGAGQFTNSLGKEDMIVSASEAKRLFEQILNGNYPPIAICGSHSLRKGAKPDNKILFTTNFNRTYYVEDDPVKIVRIGDGWGWQYIELGGEVGREASLVFLKSSRIFME